MENPKAEFFIPLMVNKLINEGTATVEVLDTTSKWFGVTYAADREATVEKIASLGSSRRIPGKAVLNKALFISLPKKNPSCMEFIRQEGFFFYCPPSI